MRAKTEAAFTLLELVVVIGVLSIVAATILPSLSHGESRSPAFECLNHHRQLCNAWKASTDACPGPRAFHSALPSCCLRK